MTPPQLDLVWPGKDKFLPVPKDKTGKPVWVRRDHPAASKVRLSDSGAVGEVPEDPYDAKLLSTGDKPEAHAELRISNERLIAENFSLAAQGTGLRRIITILEADLAASRQAARRGHRERGRRWRVCAGSGGTE